MRRLLTILALALAFAVSAADKSTAIFTLDHQMHEGCKVKINTNMRYEKGIQKIDVSLPKNTITIVYNPQKTDPAKLVDAFKKIGFNAVVLSVDGKEVDTNSDSK